MPFLLISTVRVDDSCATFPVRIYDVYDIWEEFPIPFTLLYPYAYVSFLHSSLHEIYYILMSTLHHQ